MTGPIRISMIYLYLYLYLMVFYPVDSVIRLLCVTWVRWSQWVLKMVTAAWAINNLWQLAFIEICKWFLQLIAKKLCLGCKYNWVSVRDLGEAKSGLKLQIFKNFVYITAGANSKYLITYQGSSCKYIGKAKWGSGAIKRCFTIFTVLSTALLYTCWTTTSFRLQILCTFPNEYEPPLINFSCIV